MRRCANVQAYFSRLLLYTEAFMLLIKPAAQLWLPQEAHKHGKVTFIFLSAIAFMSFRCVFVICETCFWKLPWRNFVACLRRFACVFSARWCECLHYVRLEWCCKAYFHRWQTSALLYRVLQAAGARLLAADLVSDVGKHERPYFVCFYCPLKRLFALRVPSQLTAALLGCCLIIFTKLNSCILNFCS